MFTYSQLKIKFVDLGTNKGIAALQILRKRQKTAQLCLWYVRNI